MHQNYWRHGFFSSYIKNPTKTGLQYNWLVTTKDGMNTSISELFKVDVKEAVICDAIILTLVSF